MEYSPRFIFLSINLRQKRKTICTRFSAIIKNLINPEIVPVRSIISIKNLENAFFFNFIYLFIKYISTAAITDSKVWKLDRKVFQQIMKRTGLQRLHDNLNFLKSVPLLSNLCDDVLSKLADVLEVVILLHK